MALEFNIRDGIVRTRVHGDTTGEEVTEHVISLFDRDDLPSPYRELFDSRGAAVFLLKPVQIREIISLVQGQRQFDGARFAVVADRALVYGLARMTELLSESDGAAFEFRAFRTIADAESWLSS